MAILAMELPRSVGDGAPSARSTGNERGRPGSPGRPPSRSELRHVLRGRALGALDHVELHASALGERLEAAALDRRMMDEQILAAVLGGDEAEALLIVEPLHGAGGAHATPLPRCAVFLGGAVSPNH